MSRSRNHDSMLLCAVSVAWALALSLLGSTEAALFLLPLCLIAIPLARGRYVGEELVVAAARRGRRRQSRGVASPREIALRPIAAIVPRGTAALASHLAGRGPPRLLTDLT